MWHKRRPSVGGGNGEAKTVEKRNKRTAVGPGANLPFELFQSISAGLPLSEVLAWCQVNQGYAHFCQANALWHDLLVRDFGALPGFPAAWLNPPASTLSDITAPRLWSELSQATHEQKLLFEQQFKVAAQMVTDSMVNPFLVDLDPGVGAEYPLNVAPHFRFQSDAGFVDLTIDMNLDEHSQRGLVLDIMYQGTGFATREKQEEAKIPPNTSLFDPQWYEWYPDLDPDAASAPRLMELRTSSPFRSENQPADVAGIQRLVLDSLRGFVTVLHLRGVNIRVTTSRLGLGWQTLPLHLYGTIFSLPTPQSAMARNRYAAIARMP